MKIAARCLLTMWIGVITVLAQTDEPGAEIRVTTTPPGALVTVDGVPQNVTPFNVTGLGPGDHLIELSLAGHRTARRTVTLGAMERTVLEVPLEAVTGLLLLHSQPSGADVTIEGAHRGVTPLLVTDLPLGTYRAVFSKTGYITRELELAVEGRVPRRIEAVLGSDSAVLQVNSTPPGATVTLNGLSKGVTPCRIDQIPSGSVTLRVEGRGYAPFEQTLQLDADDTESVHAVLRELPAGLSIVSVPQGARIYVNNQYRGLAPVSLGELTSGSYRVRAELDGYEVMSRSVTLNRAEQRTEEFRLQTNTATLEIATRPGGVTVVLDGRAVGKTPATSSEQVMSQPLRIPMLEPGDRQIELTRRGYYNVTFTQTLRRGESSRVQRALRKRFIPDTEVRLTRGRVITGVLVQEADAEGRLRIMTAPGITKTVKANEIIQVIPLSNL